MNTPMGNALSAYGNDTGLDRVCKRILSNKRILAWIMKYCVDEFKDCTVDDIAEKYIEGEPEVGESPTDPDTASNIRGMTTEDISLDEHTVLYDIKFSAVTPDSSGSVGLIINVEAQNRYNLGYPLIKRAMYYIARLLSAQLSTEFDGMQYGKLKKVYSIWICMNAPKDRKDSVSRYNVTEETVRGDFKEDKKNYDLMKIVMFRLNSSYEHEDMPPEALKLLNVLFSQKVGRKERKEILSEEFGVPMTGSLGEEMDYMCNLSRGLIEEGEARGIEIGEVRGVMKATALNVKALMDSLDLSFEMAADILKLPAEDRRMYKELIEKQ